MPGTGIVALWPFFDEKTGLRLIYPESRLKVDVHRSILEDLNEARIAAEDVKHLLNILHLWKGIAGITNPCNEFIAVVLAKRLAADCHNMLRREFAEHFGEDAALVVGGLTHADIARADEPVIER